MHLYQRGRIYWVKISVAGRALRRSLGTDNLREAQRRAREVLAQASVAPAERSLYAVLADWLLEVPRGRSDISIVRQLRARCADRPIAKLTQSVLAEALADVADATFNRYVVVILSAARLAQQQHGSAIPLLRKRPVRETRLRALTHAEYLRLDAALPSYLRPPVAFSLATGLRKSNVLGLTWSQVNLQAATVLIYGDQAKAGKRLVLPLSAWALEVLNAQRGLHDTLCFPGAHGQAIIEHKRAWTTALGSAGIEGFRWHDLRHTWASWAAAAGVSLLELQQLGGWASLEMVQRYAHLSPSHLRSAADQVTRPGHNLVTLYREKSNS